MKAANGKMMIGAGTVLDIKHVQMAYEAGAQFIVSPGLDLDVVTESKRLGLAVIPGALTPSEIMAAWKAGADMVKLFLADDMGMHYIKIFAAPSVIFLCWLQAE
jgi:2-dehydro-3-deoxyphosphogluconate aldolase/(4S)-4-hydroxy-2-oxoglutarate aldolase